jgi:hypothetical protein
VGFLASVVKGKTLLLLVILLLLVALLVVDLEVAELVGILQKSRPTLVIISKMICVKRVKKMEKGRPGG